MSIYCDPRVYRQLISERLRDSNTAVIASQRISLSGILTRPTHLTIKSAGATDEEGNGPWTPERRPAGGTPSLRQTAKQTI